MVRFFARFQQDQRGATAIEYGLIAGLIAVAIIGGLSSVSGAINHAFQVASTGLNP